VRAKAITDEMAIAAAHELALCARERGIHEGSILPTMDEWHVPMRLAVATAIKAQEQGLARVARTRDQVHILAESKIRAAHEAMRVLLQRGADRRAGGGKGVIRAVVAGTGLVV
jgi:malate dehydrogenase (oxaloacetate-decarboxylating)